MTQNAAVIGSSAFVIVACLIAPKKMAGWSEVFGARLIRIGVAMNEAEAACGNQRPAPRVWSDAMLRKALFRIVLINAGAFLLLLMIYNLQ